MARIMLAPALALGAVLSASPLATAAEPDKAPDKALTGFTMTLGGKGTAAQAATAKDDTEEAWCCRHRCCWGGCYGGYGGYYSGYYGGGYGGYYGGLGGYGYGSYYSYAPAYYNSFAYRPYYYRPYANYYAGGYRGGWGRGGYFGVNGTSDDANAPVMSLALATAKNPVASASGAPMRYDGGPANPVPQVKPDAEPRVPAASPGLPVSFKKETASPYRYKAYGEK